MKKRRRERGGEKEREIEGEREKEGEREIEGEREKEGERDSERERVCVYMYMFVLDCGKRGDGRSDVNLGVPKS